MDPVVLLFMLLFSAAALFLLIREGLARESWQVLVCAVLLALAFSLRAALFDRVTGDYSTFLATWVNYYRQNGGFLAFGTLPPWCNYHVPYLYFLAFFSYLPVYDLYLIKLLSVLFDLVLAWAAMKLVGRITDKPSLRLGCFFAVLHWPTIMINSSFWGQCDSIYAAFALLGLWLALEDRPLLSLVMWALSFAFKLQAIFVLPMIAVLLMLGKYKWRHLLVFPLTYLLLILPGILMGLPLWSTIGFYFTQTGSIGDGLNYNSSSVFALIDSIPDDQKARASQIAILAAAVYLAGLLAFTAFRRRQFTDRSVICMSVLMAVGLPFLLPHMHDRYFFAADVLSLVLAFCMPLFFTTAPLVEFASFLGYFAYLSFYISGMQPHFLLPMRYGAMALLAALGLTICAFLLSLGKRREPGREVRIPKRIL